MLIWLYGRQFLQTKLGFQVLIERIGTVEFMVSKLELGGKNELKLFQFIGLDEG